MACSCGNGHSCPSANMELLAIFQYNASRLNSANKNMLRIFLLLAAFSAHSLCIAGQVLTFQAKIHRSKSPTNRLLVDKLGGLDFDDGTRKLSFKSKPGDTFQIPYDSVTKVVFDVTTHMRGGALSQVVSAAGFPGAIAGAAIAGQHVHDYWFYIAYREKDQDRDVLLEVSKNSSKAVIEEANKCFGSRVSVAEFHERGTELDTDKLPDSKSKHSLKIDKQSHPLPENKPDKATIVVVCPPLAARYAGRGNQFKLHANDRVIAVNKAGTYNFAYVDPGKYRLTSQSQNANGFEMQLEGGKTYYFLQNTGQGAFKWSTMLSRNSPEGVTYLLNGSYLSDWKRK